MTQAIHRTGSYSRFRSEDAASLRATRPLYPTDPLGFSIRLRVIAGSERGISGAFGYIIDRSVGF